MKVKEEPHENYSTSITAVDKDTYKTVLYKDCRKNHAASIGKYAVDGCCEFMPAGDEGSSSALLCAACGCHRNFHTKVVLLCRRTTDLTDCGCSSISTDNSTPK
ncbi:hypothetical protein M9H77_24124 [Catharanthus roseus]|uniref:Uncharacterized protein n=1 Tax=Catharanthus roseus TaxID=4058 RepID=A0ACC0AZD0_CATRO|nr:hypothetical protein M9H77_24124 [Catharanthus roseus]